MKILITGGAGYIGSHIAKSLSQCGHSIIVFDNMSNADQHNIDFLSIALEIPIVVGDIRSKDCFNRAVIKYEPDVVIHCAALKSVAESNRYQWDYYETNVIGTMNVVEVMNFRNIKHLIFSSSAAVYKDSETACYENDKLLPSSLYGRTKVIGEQIISDLYNGSSIILRYFNPVCADPLLKKPKDDSVFSKIKSALDNQEVFSLFGTGNTRDFIHILDLMSAHQKILQMVDSYSRLLDIPYKGVFNIGSGDGILIEDLLQLAVMQKPEYRRLVVRNQDQREGEIKNSVADIRQMKKIGWLPQKSIVDIIKDSL